MANPQNKQFAMDRVEDCLTTYAPLAATAPSMTDSGRRLVIEAHSRRIKRAMSACTAALNEAKQQRLVGDRIRRLTDLIDELDMAMALLTEAHGVADEHQKAFFLRMLTDVIQESVGEERRIVWWEEAGRRQREVAESRVARTMGAGNVVNLGNAGGVRVRR